MPHTRFVQGIFHRDVVEFIVVVVTFAVFFLTHTVVAFLLVRDPEISRTMRLLGAIPPFTPFVAWRLNRRAAATVWFGVLAAYVAARIVAR